MTVAPAGTSRATTAPASTSCRAFRTAVATAGAQIIRESDVRADKNVISQAQAIPQLDPAFHRGPIPYLYTPSIRQC